MSTQEALDSLVTKEEALKLVNHHINKAPSVMDLPVFMELLTWQTKLTLWVLQEREKAAMSEQKSLTTGEEQL